MERAARHCGGPNICFRLVRICTVLLRNLSQVRPRLVSFFVSHLFCAFFACQIIQRSHIYEGTVQSLLDLMNSILICNE
jgi:hypothetical protein